MELPTKAAIDYSDTYMEFTVSGRGSATTTDAFDPDDTNALHSYYRFTCYVSSIQMADTVTATYHYTMDGTEQQVSQEYSVAQYVKNFDAVSGDYDKTTVDLAHALADYGHYAQAHLANVHGWSLDSDYTAMDEHTALTADMVAEARKGSEGYAVRAKLPEGGEVDSVSMGLDLVTDTTVRLYVTTKDGAGVESATLADGTVLASEELSDGRWLISIPGIMSHRLNETHDVRIATTGGTNAQVWVSGLSYAQAIFASERYKDDADAQNLATALWRYWRAADAFMKVHAS